ncbi:MAG: hypothetical protein DSZ04_04345 [Sulfurimonas sp.]|nr:MAG: hypothetical protein DSZ04_04345 [Sulfurimonas sp.]
MDEFDLVIVNASSTITSTANLIQKIQENNPNQNIILITAENTLLNFYALNILELQMKLCKTILFLDNIIPVLQKFNTAEYT